MALLMAMGCKDKSWSLGLCCSMHHESNNHMHARWFKKHMISFNIVLSYSTWKPPRKLQIWPLMAPNALGPPTILGSSFSWGVESAKTNPTSKCDLSWLQILLALLSIVGVSLSFGSESAKKVPRTIQMWLLMDAELFSLGLDWATKIPRQLQIPPFMVKNVVAWA